MSRTGILVAGMLTDAGGSSTNDGSSHDQGRAILGYTAEYAAELEDGNDEQKDVLEVEELARFSPQRLRGASGQEHRRSKPSRIVEVVKVGCNAWDGGGDDAKVYRGQEYG